MITKESNITDVDSLNAKSLGRNGEVIIVDDDPNFRHWVTQLMESIGIPCRDFSSCEDFLTQYDPSTSACLLLDIRMPGTGGIDLQKELLSRNYHLPIIFITAFADVPVTLEVMKNGALDVLEKPPHPQRLIEAVQRGLSQDKARCQLIKRSYQTEKKLKLLTPRESEVLNLIVQGKTAKQISRKLGISQRTVDFHRRNMLEKMGVENSVQLTRVIDEYRFHDESRKFHSRSG